MAFASVTIAVVIWLGETFRKIDSRKSLGLVTYNPKFLIHSTTEINGLPRLLFHKHATVFTRCLCSKTITVFDSLTGRTVVADFLRINMEKSSIN